MPETKFFKIKKKLFYFSTYIILNFDRRWTSMYEASSAFFSMKRAIEVFQLASSAITLSRTSTRGFPDDILMKVDELTFKEIIRTVNHETIKNV